MTEHIINKVYPDSIAEEMEIEPKDVLLTINGNEIEDVFDYRYMIKDEYIEVLIRKPDGEEWLLEIDKEYDDDLGLEFENSLMSEYRSCSNKCIFCFIDQMPQGMRDTLYFKDDDSRLSFLQGNYITLTNMKDKDIDRIINMQLAPINVSVQTTNPELRCKMLNNRFAGEKLRFLDKLYDGHVEMNGQIVCVKNVNDGNELERTITDLSGYLPFMRSVSVVPAGVTKFRDGLYPIEMFSKGDSEQIIDIVEQHQKEYYDKYGLHFIHASDELYIIAERDFPEEERYDGYIQLENGVGMMRLFISEFEEALSELTNMKEYNKLKDTIQRNIIIATGKLAYSTLCDFSKKIMNSFPNINIDVCCIKNEFFGETITVSGLITGTDLVNQLQEHINNGCADYETLVIPSNMLRSGEQVFLDDVTVDDVENCLNIKVTPADSSGKEFIEAIINKDYSMQRDNENFVYIQAYNS